MRAVIAIAAHKACELPEDPLYLPVQAGAALSAPLGIARDDSGDHISPRNPAYSELTVQYWLWKNVPADVCGLCHYRRFFTCRQVGRSLRDALTMPQLERILTRADVIVPRPRLYLLETNFSHYAHAHHAEDLRLTREALAETAPAYLPAFDRVMKRRWGRRFNMCIMRRPLFDQYSAWLFGILFTLEKKRGVPADRVYGYIAERLMDVWLEHERLRLCQLRVLKTDGEDWPCKIVAFLRRWWQGERPNYP